MPTLAAITTGIVGISFFDRFQHEFYCTPACLSTHSPDAAGVLVHIGDLHMTKAGEQNHLDLAAIVDEINQAFAGCVSFVFIRGDVADDGSRSSYAVVRGELDRLAVPWCAIIGDHDVLKRASPTLMKLCQSVTITPSHWEMFGSSQ